MSDDDEIKERDANERALEKVKRAAREEPPEPDDDGEDEGETESADDPVEDQDGIRIAPRKSRDERRRERVTLREQAQRDREDNEALRREVAEMRGRQQAFEQLSRRPEQQGQEDPYKRERDAALREMEHLQAEYDRLPSDAQQSRWQEFRTKYVDLEDQLQSIRVRREIERSSQRTQLQTQQQIWQNRIRSDFPDMFEADSNQRVNRFEVFRANYFKLVSMGNADSQETLRRAAHMTRQELRMRDPDRPAPTDRERKRYQGSSTGSSGPAEKPSTVLIRDGADRKAIKEMALSAYPHLSEKEALDRWVKRPGARLARKGVLKGA